MRGTLPGIHREGSFSEAAGSLCMADDRREFELRQLSLMAKRLEQFQDRAIPISRAISDLEGLLWALEEFVPQQWFNNFQEQWGELEISYAVAVTRPTAMPDATDPELRDATNEMLRLVRERQARLG